jgi:hypothetical protein
LFCVTTGKDLRCVSIQRARGSGLPSADGDAPPFHMGILTDMGQSV